MSLALLDWRRRVAALYAEIRAHPEPRAAHRLWCSTRDELLRSHPCSPLPEAARATFTGLAVAPYDEGVRFEPRLETDVPPLRIEVETGTDGIVAFRRLGRLRLDGLGTLDAWWLEAYAGGVFVPCRDASAGTSTYGGGRYVLDTAKGADLGGSGDRLVIDLNFAYNPSCAYDPAWACPLAPPGNVLGVAVAAGELDVVH